MPNGRSYSYKVLGAAFLWGSVEIVNALKDGQTTAKNLSKIVSSNSEVPEERVFFVLRRLVDACIVKPAGDPKDPSYCLSPIGMMLSGFIAALEEEKAKELHTRSVEIAEKAIPE